MQYIVDDYNLSDPVFNDSDSDPDFNPNRQFMLSLCVTRIHSHLNKFL